MNSLKFLMILLIVSTSIYAKERPSDKDTAAALRQASTILKQENNRWKDIHNNPSKDEITLIQEEEEFIIKLQINPSVKNIVNSQSITREWIIPKDPGPQKGLLNGIIEDTDLYFMGGMNTDGDLDIGILGGYHPLFFKGFGFGPLVCIRSLSFMIYYSAGVWNMDHVIIGLGIGTDYSGTVSNFMIGVKF